MRYCQIHAGQAKQLLGMHRQVPYLLLLVSHTSACMQSFTCYKLPNSRKMYSDLSRLTIVNRWDQTSGSRVTSLGPFVCPSGYTVAWSRQDYGIDSKSQYTGCCPSGYSYTPVTNTPMQNGAPRQCESIYTNSTISVMTPSSAATQTVYSSDFKTLNAGVIVQGVQVNGWNFPSASSTTSSPVSSSPTTPTANAQSAMSTTSSSGARLTSTAAYKAGISVGASIGIGVGAGAAIFLLVSFLAFFLYRCHNLRKKTTRSDLSPNRVSR